LCKPDTPLIIIAFICLTIAATGEALLPALQGGAINAALGVESQANASLGDALFKMLSIGVGTAIFTGLRGFLFWICGARLVKRLRALLFEALLAQPQAFHDDQGPGELSSRLANDCVRLGDVLSFNVNILLRQVIQSIAGVLVVTRVNGRLSALVLCGVALRGVFAHIYSKFSRRVAILRQDALAASSGVAEQCLSLIELVRAHGNEAYEAERYESQLKRLLGLDTKRGAFYGSSRVFNGSVNWLMLFGVLTLGSSFVASGILAKEALTSFVLYVWFISNSSSDVADQIGRISEALGAAAQVFDYLEPQPFDPSLAAAPVPVASSASPSTGAHESSTTHEMGATTAATRGELVFESVDFAYPTRPTEEVFNSLSLTVPSGQRIAIVGGSGSGKSTLFALALRFYAPKQGRVLLDGQDLRNFDNRELRSRVAWVQQEPPLFPNLTIRENIAYGLKDCPLERVKIAAEEANATDFILAFPDGFDMRIGAAGTSLSGGPRFPSMA
jgi:ABC-type multidrug transport system fused ATPase/permease subunit